MHSGAATIETLTNTGKHIQPVCISKSLFTEKIFQPKLQGNCEIGYGREIVEVFCRYEFAIPVLNANAERLFSLMS